MKKNRTMLGGRAAGRLGGNNITDGKRVLGGILFLFALVMLTGSLAVAQEDAAMETIRVNVEKVLEVLRDPALQGEAAEQQKKEAIRKISNEMFHWDLVSKRVLSKNWKNFSDEQQQEFISLFKEILEQAYADRILAYKDETIKYVSCQMLAENKAEVETNIISGGTPINLTYRLGLLDGKWGVYDVIVEGASLTSNYRTQFRDYLADKKPVELLDHLKKMVEE